MTMRPIVSLLLALCAAPALARAQADTPDAPEAEEYAVWSAVLRQLYGRDPRVAVEDATLVLRGPLEVDSGILFGIGIPVSAVDSLNATTRRAAPIDLGRVRAGRARIVGRDRWKEGMPRISLTRVGFDPSGTRAVVYVSMTCGPLCGFRGMVSARRDERGRWRFHRHLTMSFSCRCDGPPSASARAASARTAAAPGAVPRKERSWRSCAGRDRVHRRDSVRIVPLETLPGCSRRLPPAHEAPSRGR